MNTCGRRPETTLRWHWMLHRMSSNLQKLSLRLRLLTSNSSLNFFSSTVQCQYSLACVVFRLSKLGHIAVAQALLFSLWWLFDCEIDDRSCFIMLLPGNCVTLDSFYDFLVHARYRMCICAIYIHAYMYVYIYMYACLYIYIYIYVCIYMYMHICMDVYVCVCVCVCVCVYVYMYMYVYIHIYISLYRMYVQFVSCSIGE